LQLLATFSSLAIRPKGESGDGDGVRAVDGRAFADRVRPVDDVGRDVSVLTTCFGLAACFGASTVTEGSGAGELVAVCDATGPHSKTVDKKAKAEGATNFDDSLMTMSFRGTDIPSQCLPAARH
jgi:hypothetical protein